MQTSSGFPRELLDQSKEQRLFYFESFTIAHPKLRETTARAVQFIGNQQAKASCITIVGPTGVGKTTLLQKVEQVLIEQALPNLKKTPGRIPVIRVEAIAPESGSFNWKDYFLRCLLALEEPLIDYKIDYKTRGVRRDSSGELIIEPKTSSPIVRQALENALIYRQPIAVLIDEAQHMQKMASGRRLQDNMDCIKSMANLTRVPHVLIGTYELLAFHNLSGQLSRRNQSIHFSRYRAEYPEDVTAFKTILNTFQRHLPLKEEPDLVSHWKNFYARSLGCVGILKDWLTRALADALEDNSSTLTLQHIEQRAMSIAQCNRILQEIEEGERSLRETQQDYEQLLNSLGLGDKIPAPLPNPLPSADAVNATTKSSNKRRSRKPGTPNPVRRKVK
ncbi:ATP-binding protein [Oculatella sp. LEGE 06141]|uniref:ATP-binding protein n=1 Tax=Oculatella sp. LEGE 06141 TaxID=1828648 RepID=UPI001880C948|nr:ATP-binding protein [Oculatella sp. LEGE 06141]MBE9178500.1 ATP-binding protein [Oculatella sp. LEGE 06141]